MLPSPAEPLVLARGVCAGRAGSWAQVCPAPATPCGVPGKGASDLCPAVSSQTTLWRGTLSDEAGCHRLGHPHSVILHKRHIRDVRLIDRSDHETAKEEN